MFKYLISLIAAGSLMLVSAATSPSIGVVQSKGEFRVDGSTVRGNGTVFEGNLVETASARSVIQLADAQITLAPNSSARVYRDRTVLEKGTGSFKDGANRVIEADTLRIVPSTQDSVVQVEITDSSRVTVGARGGAAEVRNSSGMLTASLLPGMSLAFNPRAAAASSVKITGCESHDGAYFLTDETSKVTFQLQGADVPKYVGKKVEVTGSSIPGAVPAAGASQQLVEAVTIKQVKGTCKAGAAAAAGAGGAGAATAGVGAAAGAGAASGISVVAIGAIVGGVAVAGTVGGLAAAGTFSSAAPISRQ